MSKYNTLHEFQKRKLSAEIAKKKEGVARESTTKTIYPRIIGFD
jgi:hypothetical protein